MTLCGQMTVHNQFFMDFVCVQVYTGKASACYVLTHSCVVVGGLIQLQALLDCGLGTSHQ